MSKNKDRAKARLNIFNLFSRAWKIAWSNKVLWLFSLVSGLISITDIIGIGELKVKATYAFIVGGTVIFIASIYGEAGLIYGSLLANRNNGRASPKDTFTNSHNYFPRLFSISSPLIVFAVILQPGLLEGFLKYSTDMLGSGGLLVFVLLTTSTLIILRILAIPFGSVIYIVRLAIVVNDLNVWEAVRRSWNVLIKDLWEVIRLEAAVSFVVGFLLLAINSPFLFISPISDPPNSLLISNGVGLIFLADKNPVLLSYIPIAMFLASIVNAWATGTWVLAYKQLSSNLPTPNRSKRQ